MSSQNSLTTLKRQAAAFRREHVIPEGQTARKRQAAPSVLFTLVEARSFDAEAVATLAQHGLAAIGAIDPDAIGFGALFEGPPQDRDLLTAVENTRLNKELRALLLLLSPHLMLRAAQEVLEGLLHRFHVHRWNVDDVIACALPYHDSTLFTKLLQGLHVAGKPRWSWLQPLKEKPSTLIRPTLAKYCAKDYSVLAFIGELLQETSALQKTNRPLSTLFTAVWLDALAGCASPGPDLVLTALPPLLASLRRPHLRDVFHAAVSVGGALCVKVELEPAVKAQLLERAAKHASGELGLTSLAFMALVLQLQAGDGFPAKALHSVLAAGSEAVLQALPPRVDCGNLLAVLVEASILQAASGAENGEDEDPEAFVEGLLSVSAIVDQYGSPIALALLQVFQKLCVDQVATAAEQKTIAALLRKPLKAIGARQPMALSAALTKAVDYFSARGAKTDALAQLVASDGDVGSVPLVDSDGSIVDVIRAFSDKSAKKRGKAVQKAVADLERSVKSETDLTRQRVLVSLLLQAAQDEDLEVAKKTLQLEVLWAQLPQADAATTVPFLLSLLARLLPDTRVSGDSLEALFKSLFLGDARVRVLTPLVIRCLALVYSRADCEEALRRSVDISLLPLLVLSIVGLDLLANKKELEGQDELRTAVMHFCAASKHGLFARFKSGTATTLSKIPASSIDCSVVTGLCHLVQGRPWAAVQVEELRHPLAQSVLIGGKAAQMAAVALLGDKLPGLLETTANDASDETEQVLMQCAEACECFARHQSYMEVGDCDGSELLCKLSQVVVSAVTAVCSKQGGMASSSTSTPTKRTRMRRKSAELGASGGSGTASDSLQQALVKLLRVALERPRSMSAVLRGALGAGSQFVRPALLQLALAPEQHSGSGTRGRITATVTTNALLVLHGLLSSKAADEWGPDQSLVVPLTAKLAHTGSPEVRKAVLSLLELLRDVDWDALVPPSWQSHCAAGLRQAGIVRSHQALLSAKGWAAVSEQEFMLAGVPKKSLQAFLDHLSSHKAEILQDGSAVGALLAQFLVAKGGIVKSARMNDCAFWSAGLSMLEQPAGIVASPLVSVVPSSGFLASLKEPLRCSLEEVVASLSAKGAGLTEAPLLLRVAALKVSEMTAGGQLPAGLGEKGEAASRTALDDFIKGLVLPLCSGISDHSEQKRGPVPELIADLACALVACVPQALKAQASPELNAVTAKELLRLCVASAPAPKTAPAEDALGVSASVFSAAHSAFVSAPMEATLLCQMLKSPAFKAKSVGSSSRRTALEAIYQHIVGFDNACPGSGALLVELGELAKRESKVAVDADESHADGPMSFTMLSIAALSENIGSFGDTSGDIPASLASVCTSLSEISNTLGSKLTSGMLASIVRSCNALLPSAKMDSSSATPPPVLTCVEALGCFKHALAPEVLGLLKVSLRRFWKYTEQSEGDLLALQEKSAQSHIRLLLQTMIVRCPGLLPDVTPDLCLSLARSVGLNASLDFAALAILARRLVAGPGRKRSNKRRASKKEAEQDAAVEEALGAAVNYGDELALDEVTTMFVSVGCGNRFHGLGTLAQTLSSLCLELSKPGEPGLGKSGQSFWGPSLLPESFVQDVGKEHAFRALEMGLASMHRVIEEHGLPEALDDVKIDATAYRSASGISTEDAIEDDKYTVVLSLCYVVKATCVIEALLDGAPDMSTASVEPCKTRVRELRGLLLRSLSVNHPQTFFQAVCFGLQVEGLSRTPGKKDLLAKEDFRIVETRHLLKSTSEALRKRRELISATNGNADDEDALEAQSACAPLCTAALRHVCQNMLRKSDSGNNSAEELHVIIWRFLDGLCRFSARAAPTPVLEECLPAAALCLQKVVSNDSKSGARSAVACCLCLLTAVEELGRGILPCLDKILPSVLDLVGSSSFRGVDQGPEIDDLALLEISSLQLLQTLIKKLGAFLSPYLERICLLLIAPGPLQRVKLLQGLGKEVVASVPHRLLLPAVQSGVATAASHLAGDGADSAIDKVDSCLINLQRFGVMLVWIFSVASPEFVSSFAEVATDSIVRLLAVGPAAAGRFLHLGGRAEDLPIRILRRDLHQKALLVADSDELAWSAWCTESSVLRMNALGAAAFTHFSLRLSIDDLKPRFLTILDWARNTQLQALTKQSTRKAAVEVDILADTDDACRVLALCSVMQGLASEAPEISEELFLPLALKDLVSCLAAGQRQARHLAAKHRANSKRKRRALSGGEWANTSRSSEVLHGHTWWWFEVMRATFGFITQSLRHAGGSASQTKVVDEAVEILIEPVAEALAICEFLPAYEDSGLTSAFLEAIQTALVVLAAASDGQRIKRLLTAVLSKSRSEDPELRLCSVKACHRIWADIGVQAVSGLSEVLMFAVELLEDEDPRVEGAVRSLVKTMETCTGESLQEHLKQ